MSELVKRILFAVPAAALFLYVAWIGSFYFVGIIILISLFIQRELSRMSESAGFKPDQFFPYTIGLWVLLTPYLPYSLLIGFGLFLLFVGIQVFKTGDRALKALVSTFFCGIYVPVGLLALLMIRDLGNNETGFLLTVGLLLMVWGNDIFAYFGGKTFGKHLFAPTVSPNKTWEGFFFGIFGALVGLAILVLFISSSLPLSFITMVPGAVLISIFGPLGDLTESRIKRAANVKDASDILPGHGGFFDRFDALILAAPVFYVYLSILKIVGYASF